MALYRESTAYSTTGRSCLVYGNKRSFPDYLYLPPGKRGRPTHVLVLLPEVEGATVPARHCAKVRGNSDGYSGTFGLAYVACRIAILGRPLLHKVGIAR
jgi:hypothetical protein